MKAQSAGRPKEVGDKDIVTLDECLERSRIYLHCERSPFCRRTLQNKISRGEFTRYGTYHEPMVDWGEVRRSLNWKRKAG